MHLDTVCTMVDRDAVVMYPAIADSLAGLRGRGRARLRARSRSWRGRRGRDGDPRAAGHRHRPRPGHGRARAVGRRQQHARAGAGRRRRLRAQHEDQRAARAPRGSRCSRSRAPSWAPGAAGRAACRVRSLVLELVALVGGGTCREPPSGPCRAARHVRHARWTAWVGAAAARRLGHLLYERSRSSHFGPEGPCRSAAGGGRRARLNYRCFADGSRDLPWRAGCGPGGRGFEVPSLTLFVPANRDLRCDGRSARGQRWGQISSLSGLASARARPGPAG